MQAESKHYISRLKNVFVLFERRKNCHSSGRNPLLHLFIRREMELTVVLI
jgi:hypothetical protein